LAICGLLTATGAASALGQFNFDTCGIQGCYNNYWSGNKMYTTFIGDNLGGYSYTPSPADATSVLGSLGGSSASCGYSSFCFSPKSMSILGATGQGAFEGLHFGFDVLDASEKGILEASVVNPEGTAAACALLLLCSSAIGGYKGYRESSDEAEDFNEGITEAQEGDPTPPFTTVDFLAFDKLSSGGVDLLPMITSAIKASARGPFVTPSGGLIYEASPFMFPNSGVFAGDGTIGDLGGTSRIGNVAPAVLHVPECDTGAFRCANNGDMLIFGFQATPSSRVPIDMDSIAKIDLSKVVPARLLPGPDDPAQPVQEEAIGGQLVVPEPGSVTVFCGALLSLLLARRRQRREPAIDQRGYGRTSLMRSPSIRRPPPVGVLAIAMIAASCLGASRAQAAPQAQPCVTTASDNYNPQRISVVPLVGTTYGDAPSTYCQSAYGWSDTWFVNGHPANYNLQNDVLSGDSALKVPLIWVEGRMKKKNPSSGIGLPKRIETAGFAL
jgi:hypothetical protein